MLPEIITILGHKYVVKRDIEANVAQALGVLDSHTDVVHVASGLSPDREASVLLHEIIEAIDEYLDFNLDHRTISGLSSALFDVLTDNGLLCLSRCADIGLGVTGMVTEQERH